MKRILLGALAGMVLMLTLIPSALAGTETSASPFSQDSLTASVGMNPITLGSMVLLQTFSQQEVYPPEISGGISVNGIPLSGEGVTFQSGTTSVPLRNLTEALYPQAKVAWENEYLSAQWDGNLLIAQPGLPFFSINGRFLYVPEGVSLCDNRVCVPLRLAATALGADVSWDGADASIAVVGSGTPLQGGYNEEDLYWMSRAINAESGNQPLAGKIAVGTVILNRVASEQFPDTVKQVIFDRRYGSYQFSIVPYGTVYNEPNDESILAAKLCLDGAREAGDSLFFHVVGLNCWTSANRPYVTTIAEHSFYL